MNLSYTRNLNVRMRDYINVEIFVVSDVSTYLKYINKTSKYCKSILHYNHSNECKINSLIFHFNELCLLANTIFEILKFRL